MSSEALVPCDPLYSVLFSIYLMRRYGYGLKLSYATCVLVLKLFLTITPQPEQFFEKYSGERLQ